MTNYYLNGTVVSYYQLSFDRRHKGNVISFILRHDPTLLEAWSKTVLIPNHELIYKFNDLCESLFKDHKNRVTNTIINKTIRWTKVTLKDSDGHINDCISKREVFTKDNKIDTNIELEEQDILKY